jgi:hypothetical protein
MDDGVAAGGRAGDGAEVEHVVALGEVEAHDRIAAALELGYDVAADPAAMPSEENAHRDRIAVAGRRGFERSL